MVTMVFEKFLQLLIVGTYDLLLEIKGCLSSWETPTEMTLDVNTKINTGVCRGVCVYIYIFIYL